MLNIRNIRKRTMKSRIKNVERQIKSRADEGNDFLATILDSPISDIYVDADVIKGLRAKGFKINQEGKKLVISWK